MDEPLRAGEPPDAVARLAKALFSLDSMLDARSTLMRAEPRTDPDAVWRATRVLQSRAQLVATLLEPFLYDEQSLWEAIRWIQGAD